MSIVPKMLLVNIENNEKHHINSAESVIGRGWLNCDDKRISRCHGVLKVISPNSIAVISTHQNLMFFRKKDNAEVNRIHQNTEVNLFVGDSFGLLVDEFWFSIQPLDNVCNDITNSNQNATQQNQDEPTTSTAIKRKTSSDSEPDSTNKRVKTEPIEYQENYDLNTTDPNGDTTEARTCYLFPSSANNLQNVHSDGTNMNQPNDAQSTAPIRIKTESLSEEENVDSSTIRIKTEPLSQEENVDSSTIAFQIKTEVKSEPADDNNVDDVATSSNQPAQRPQRPCCRYGIRCYRRNPSHRAEEAHPGDVDYRLPDYPDPPLGAPACPFLDRCYRRNPIHFQQFSHKIWLKPKPKDGYEATVNPPNAPTGNMATNESERDSDDDEDPFATDEDSDYVIDNDE